MVTTMDKAGRVVLPKQIRDELGLVPGEITLSVRGTDVLISQPASRLREQDGHLLLPTGGLAVTVAQVRELRLADQR